MELFICLLRRLGRRLDDIDSRSAQGQGLCFLLGTRDLSRWKRHAGPVAILQRWRAIFLPARSAIGFTQKQKLPTRGSGKAAQDRQKAEKREARAVAKVQGAFPSAGTGRAVVQPVVLSSVQLPFWHLVGLIFKIMLASLIVTFVLMPLFLGAVFAGVTMYGMVVGSMVGG